MTATCIYVEDYLDNFIPCDCILIDEAQFLTKDQVDQFVMIADTLEIPIIAFGLKTDFQGNLFEGSKRLLEVADEIQEITTICWCGKKARYNARVINGKIVKFGNQVQLGGNESYVSLCRKHYNLSQLK